MNASQSSVEATSFWDLHQGSKILVLPNAWDCVSARLFEQAGFPAIGTTSGGIAAVLGYPDGQCIPAGEMLGMVGRIAKTVSVPLAADLEGGYGSTPDQVAQTIRQAISAGVVGANIEDSDAANHRLRDLAYQVEVINAIRAIVQSSGASFVLNARTDVYLHGSEDDQSRFKETVRRALAYREAGADCIFPIALKDRETIGRLVKEIGCAMNIMAGLGVPTIAELEQLGVRRVTFGSGLMRATLPLIRQMAQELRASGNCDPIVQTQFSHATVNQLFTVRYKKTETLL